jgi:hypothetical protein
MFVQLVSCALLTITLLQNGVVNVHAWDLTEFRSPDEFRKLKSFVDGEGSTGKGYTDTWVVHVDGGPITAAVVARDLGYENLGKVRAEESRYNAYC